jgi:DNA-binding MarR family transcriptional regulator
MNLTPAQLRLLRDIDRWNIAHWRTPPTLQELADLHGLAKVSVFEMAADLIRKGVLMRVAGQARSLAITAAGRRAMRPRATRLLIAGAVDCRD